MDNVISYKGKQFLPDVVVARSVLVIILVLYHSFCPYIPNGWPHLSGQKEILAYTIGGQLLCPFLLEAWVFVSGYVLGYNVKIKGDSVLAANKLILCKFKRLMVPSIIFSILYIALFARTEFDYPIWLIIYNIMKGQGHLWFLPMLFWCFIFIFILEKVSIQWWLKMFVVIIAAIFVQPEALFLRFGQSTYFFLFFYIGYLFQTRSWNDAFQRKKFLGISIFLYTAVIVLLLIFNADTGVLLSIGKPILNTVSKMLYSVCGIFFMMSSISLVIANSRKVLSPVIIRISSISFGIYLLQEFFIRLFYYKIPFLQPYVSSLWAPWVVFIFSLFISIQIALFCRKTKIGRLLIGE